MNIYHPPSLTFLSDRERRLWLWATAAVVGIFATLGLASTLASELRDRGLITDGFWLGIGLVALSALAIGLRVRPSGLEIGAWIGIAAIYLLIILRMAVPEERSHMIEYTIVAALVFEALRERGRHGSVRHPALIAVVGVSAIGAFDEVIQLLIPSRVFDPVDIGFNSLAAVMAVSASLVLGWVRARVTPKARG